MNVNKLASASTCNDIHVFKGSYPRRQESSCTYALSHFCLSVRMGKNYNIAIELDVGMF